MEKYVVKTVRAPGEAGPSQPCEKRMKQATIDGMKGVVVVENILRLKALLQVKNQTTECLLETLSELEKKVPAREVLKSTKIGHAIHVLYKHPDAQVSKLARHIVKTWRTFYVDKLDSPMLEVAFDKQSEDQRRSGRTLLANALGSLGEASTLAEAIEKETFQELKILNSAYKRTIRHMVFVLKHKSDLRKRVLARRISTSDFVQSHKKPGKPSS